jgi:hypothetical protein
LASFGDVELLRRGSALAGPRQVRRAAALRLVALRSLLASSDRDVSRLRDAPDGIVSVARSTSAPSASTTSACTVTGLVPMLVTVVRSPSPATRP